VPLGLNGAIPDSSAKGRQTKARIYVSTRRRGLSLLPEKDRRGDAMTAGSFLLGLICGAVLMALVLELFRV
jgi:hypothetical protein